MIEFRLLGPVEVVKEGERLPLGGNRQRGLLALLLMHANEVVSSDRLIDELWQERPPRDAANTLQLTVSRLRKLLGDAQDGASGSQRIVTRSPGYVLQIGPEELDLHRFEQLVASGARELADGDAEEAAATIREGLALWRGPALGDLADEGFAQPEIGRLEGARLAALELRIEADLVLGSGPELVPELEALVAANPLQERLRGGLMLALYRSGRQAEALEVYRDTRKLLAEELGLEPSKALQRLEKAILVQDASLDPAVRRGPAGAEHAALVCPFKGLAAFEVADAGYFFGRERLVAELIARLVGAKLLGVIGPSGSGKSSIVRAGLLPALAAGAIPGSDRWRCLLVRPGEHPLEELEYALGESNLTAALGELGRDERIAVVVDQFEEVFTACGREEERGAFIDALVDLARQRDSRAVVVIALRADFYGRCAAYPELAEMLSANHVLVGPMDSDELRRAIELPASRAGLEIEPELVDRLVGDVAGESGGLPILSTTLLELWQRRDGRFLRIASYERMGGVRGAVARLAEDAYQRLSEPQQQLARSVLLRLAGGEEGEAVVRRRVPLAEFDAERNEDVARVLGVLTERRLLTASDGWVEIAHEVLLREWPRLQGWLEEDAYGRRLHRHLIHAAREWDESGRDPGELYRGARLASALDWSGEHMLELNELEREFLSESRAASERATERHRRTNLRLRSLLVGVAIFLVLALIAGALAFVQRGHARRAATAAEAERLGAQALVEQSIDRSLLLAREGVNLDDSLATRGNLLAALLRSPAAFAVLHGDGDRLLRNAVTPDGHTLAVADNNGTVVFFDTGTLHRIGKPFQGSGAVFALAFSPDGQTLAVGNSGPKGAVLDLVDAHTHTRTAETVSRRANTDGVAFSADGSALVTAEVKFNNQGSPDEFIVLRNPRSGRETGRRARVPEGNLAGFTPEGRFIVATMGETTTILLDARTLQPVRKFDVGGTPALSPDGGTAALGQGDGTIVLLDLRTGKQQRMSSRAGGGVDAMSFSPDGRTLAAAASDGSVSVWDVPSASARETFKGHTGGAEEPVFSPDGKTLYTSSLDSSIIVWDVAGSRRLGRPLAFAHANPPASAASLAASVSPDGSLFAISPQPGQVTLWDPKTLTAVGRPLSGPTGDVYSVAFSPDGRTLAAAGASGTTVLFDLRTRSIVRRLPPGRHMAGGWVAFSPDGNLLVTGRADGFAVLYDVKTGAQIAELQTPGAVGEANFSPDSRVLATASEGGRVILWNVAHRLRLRTLKADEDSAYTARFSPDGTLLATGGGTGTAILWDVKTGKPVGRPLTGHNGSVVSATFDPSGRTLVTSSFDGKLRLWDVASQAQIGTALPGPVGPSVTSFFPDSKHLLGVHAAGLAVLWTIDPNVWKARACEVARRNLTRSEWQEFIPDRSYRPVCPA